MNMFEQVSLRWDEVSFGYIPDNGIAGSSGRSIDSSLRSCHTDLHGVCTSLQLHQQRMSVLHCSTSWLHQLPFVSIALSYSDRCKIKSQSNFDWHFHGLKIWILFSVSQSFDFHLFIILCLALYTIFNWVLFLLVSIWVLYLFWILALYWFCSWWNLFSFCRLLLCPNDGVLCHAEDFQFQEVPCIY